MIPFVVVISTSFFRSFFLSPADNRGLHPGVNPMHAAIRAGSPFIIDDPVLRRAPYSRNTTEYDPSGNSPAQPFPSAARPSTGGNAASPHRPPLPAHRTRFAGTRRIPRYA